MISFVLNPSILKLVYSNFTEVAVKSYFVISNKEMIIAILLIGVSIALLWLMTQDDPPAPPPVTPVSISFPSYSQNPRDYLYGWENYPRGPAWAFGDRVPYASAKRALGGHFGGGVYSPRDPILESKLGGVRHFSTEFSPRADGSGGDGHW